MKVQCQVLHLLAPRQYGTEAQPTYPEEVHPDLRNMETSRSSKRSLRNESMEDHSHFGPQQGPGQLGSQVRTLVHPSPSPQPYLLVEMLLFHTVVLSTSPNRLHPLRAANTAAPWPGDQALSLAVRLAQLNSGILGFGQAFLGLSLCAVSPRLL